MMTELITSPPHVEEMEPIQVSEPPAEYLFETEPYEACWWRELSPKFKIGERAAHWVAHHKPLGPIPFRELRLAGWNHAWTQNFDAARAEEFLAFQRRTPWDVARLRWSDRHADRQAIKLLGRAEIPYRQLPGPPEYMIDLTQGWEGYLKSVSQNTRSSLKKKLKKAAPLNPELVAFSPSEIDRFFEMFFSAHIPYWEEKAGRSYFNDPRERSFIVAWARELAASGQLLLQGTKFDDQWVNLGMSVVCDDMLYWLLTINTGLYPGLSPGMVALGLQLQHAIERGIALYNMSSGDYFYKIQMSNRVMPTHELLVVNPKSLKGKAYAAWLERRLKR